MTTDSRRTRYATTRTIREMRECMTSIREVVFSLVHDGIEHVTSGSFGECTPMDVIDLFTEFKSMLNKEAVEDFEIYMKKS